MGPIDKGFHFLGVDFKAPSSLHIAPKQKTLDARTQELKPRMVKGLNQRTYHRVIDKAIEKYVDHVMGAKDLKQIKVSKHTWQQCHGPPNRTRQDPSTRMFYQQLLLNDDNKQALGKNKNLTVAGHPAQVHQSLYRSLSWWARATGLDPDQLLQVAEAFLSAVLACCSTPAVVDADACASFTNDGSSNPSEV